jgi:transcriptional regulator with XRE-family HTH domain
MVLAPAPDAEMTMPFRSWRKRMLLSQERIAEMSGVSLRTVQRLEAGHRVSYATLRALAAALSTDADLLEREFYAVNSPTGEFIEMPRWARLLRDGLWFGGERLSRRDALVVEGVCLALAALAFALSLLVLPGARASAVRLGSLVPLLGAYLTAVSIRARDQQRSWPGCEHAPAPTPRGWPGVAAEYAFFVAAGVAGTAVAAWLLAAL